MNQGCKGFLIGRCAGGIVRKELKGALVRWEGILPDDIYVIPLRIDDRPIPELLKDLHIIDWEDGKGKDKLLEAIRDGMERQRIRQWPCRY
jgi:hypothetical protein